jgi:hypothetical protein
MGIVSVRPLERRYDRPQREPSMKRFYLSFSTVALLIVLGITGPAIGQQNISGKWTSEFDSQVGHQKYTYDFKIDGEKLTGRAHRDVDGDVRDTQITEGKINGDDISFVEVLKTDDQELRIEYKGKIVGGELKLTRAVGDIATSDIVAKRLDESTTQPTTQPATQPAAGAQ